MKIARYLPMMTSSPEKFIWQYSWFFEDPLPSWSGSMQLIYSHIPLKHAGKASITFLPIIDLMPSDMNCMFSTLRFVSNLAYSLEKPTVITADQPPCWKASKIIQNTANPVFKKFIVKLGTCLKVMNLLGAIDTIMENTGLSNVLEMIYKENSCITYSKRERYIPSAMRSFHY